MIIHICITVRIDWKITKFIPDCSPVEDQSHTSTCPPGWESRDHTCVACPPGMFRDQAPLCQLCGKASYTATFGSSRCDQCPSGQYTLSLGSRNIKECRSSNFGNRYLSLQNKYNRNQINIYPPRVKHPRNFMTRPTTSTTTTTTPAPTTTTRKSISRSRGYYGGLTHYNSWFVGGQQRQQKQQQSRYSNNNLYSNSYKSRRHRRHRRH